MSKFHPELFSLWRLRTPFLFCLSRAKVPQKEASLSPTDITIPSFWRLRRQLFGLIIASKLNLLARLFRESPDNCVYLTPSLIDVLFLECLSGKVFGVPWLLFLWFARLRNSSFSWGAAHVLPLLRYP